MKLYIHLVEVLLTFNITLYRKLIKLMVLAENSQ